jgi:hypothetical protein
MFRLVGSVEGRTDKTRLETKSQKANHDREGTASCRADSFERDPVSEALRNNTIDTLLGDLRFEPDGDLVDPQIWIYQVQNEEFAQVD